jgi:hypothetical protein
MSAEGESDHTSIDTGSSNFRWISNRQSAENGEVSILSIIETGLVGMLFYFVYRWLGETWHFALAACLAPFLLLRTDRVNTLSLKLAERVFKYSRVTVWPKEERPRGLSALRESLCFHSLPYTIPFAVTAIKAISTLRCLMAHPVETFGEIPRNWRRVVLCTDMGAIPELIPTLEHVRESSPLAPLKASYTIHQITRRPVRSLSEMNYRISIGVIVGIFMLLPALAYRFAVKSTAVIWSPLLWAVRPMSTPVAVKVIMRRILTVNFYKISRAYSTCVLLLFIGKMYLLLKWTVLHTTYDTSQILQALRPYVVPEAMPIWHVTSALNAAGSWGLYFVADYFYKDVKHGTEIPETTLHYLFTWTGTVMSLFAVYSLLCTVYITVQVASTLDWPPLGAKFMPW